MSWLHIVSAVVVIALLIYLIAALLNPEDFS
ncbi:MAG: K(+)-transporting ATPase subunit F [Sterolibacterium sp.]